MIGGFAIRHPVDSARVKRMALAQALQGEPATLYKAVSDNGLFTVMGAGRIKAAAIPQKRADQVAI